MPSVYNIGNLNNTNEKKISSKLTFEVGESFKGKIIGNDSDNQAIIKLVDGWQFSAEVEGDIQADTSGLIKFEVEDFQGGKLKLKIIANSGNEAEKDTDIIGNFAQKAGMKASDIDILKALVKHNIPLTRENVTFAKSIISFNMKANINPNEVNQFIDKFIEGKGIPQNSEQAQSIRETLNEFFTSFQTLDSDDILLFFENNIELTKENIDSYNTLFKSDETIKEYFDKIAENLDKVDLEQEIEVKSVEQNIQNTNDEVHDSSIQSNKNEFAAKVYDSNNNAKEKVSMLSLLKSMAGDDINLAKETFKEVLAQNTAKFTTNEYNNLFNKLNSLSDNDFVEIIKNSIGEKTVVDDDVVKNVINNLLGKDIELSDSELQRVKDVITLQLTKEENSSPNTLVNNTKEAAQSGEVSQNEQSQQNKDVQEQSGVKKNIEANKQKIQENNNGSKVSSEDKMNGKVNKAVDTAKSGVTKFVSELSSKDIVKSELDEKINSMKTIIKQIIAHSSADGKNMDKIMEFIKNNMNDFKIFNSISNEYYYLDVPIKRDNEEYGCKLIIKDSRKEGKKIDSTNVKMVVTVDTARMGEVDGYLAINKNTLNVDIKCSGEYVKILNKYKSNLMDGLEKLGYITNVRVSEKQEETVELTTCREFFSEKHNRTLDIKV